MINISALAAASWGGRCKKCKNRTAGAKSGPGGSYDLIVSQMLLQRPAQPSKHSRLAIFVAFHNFQFHNLAVLHKKM